MNNNNDFSLPSTAITTISLSTQKKKKKKRSQFSK